MTGMAKQSRKQFGGRFHPELNAQMSAYQMRRFVESVDQVRRSIVKRECFPPMAVDVFGGNRGENQSL
jgi:hypothetical protein